VISKRLENAVDAHLYPPASKSTRRTTVAFDSDVYELVLQVAEKLGTTIYGTVNLLCRSGAEDVLDWVEQTGFGFDSKQGLTALGRSVLEEWLASNTQLQELSGEAATRYIATYARNLAQLPDMSYPEEASAPGKAVRA